MNDMSYKNLIMRSPFGVAYHKINLDEQGRPVDYTFLEVNKAFEMMTGLIARDITNKKVTEVLPGIDQGDFNWISFYGKIALGRKSTDFEQYSEPLKRWYKVFVYSPEREYFITVFTDTTKEKLKLEEVDRFFSINLDLLCIADTDGNFVKVNKSWEEVLGYSAEDLEKKKFLSFVHPDDMQATLDALLVLKANKPVMNFTNRYRSKDGSYRYIEWRSHPYGHLIYSAARDITERIETEKNLKETQKRLASAQSFASVGTWEYDVNEGRLFWSKECEALFGLDEGEFEGTFNDFLKRVHPDDLWLVVNTNQPITQYYEAKPLEYEHRIIRKDGAVRWVRESAGVVKGAINEPKKIVGFVMDITRHKEAEQQLQKSESRYRGLVESQSDLIVRVDTENRLTFVNDAYCKTFGRSREDLIGKSFAPLVHEDDLPATLEAIKALEKPPYRCQLAQRAMTKDGWRWIHWEDNAILDGDGNIVEIQGVGRDISDLKNAEEKLKISETRLKSLLAETPAVVYSYQFKNGIPDITYINENVENILGFKPDYFLHNFEAWAACVHPDDLKKNMHRFENMEQKLQAGQEGLFEYRFKDKQGEYHWLSDRQRVLVDNDGKLFIVGVWIDITQQKKSREAIENEEKLRQIIENMDGVFWLRSADRQQMLYVSDAYETIFGRSKESLKNDPASFIGSMHPDDKERILAAYNSFLKTGKFNQEYRMTKPDGEERWLHSKAFPVKNAEGQIVRYAGIVTDITETKMAANELLAAKEKAKENDRLKSAFLATISHELRTPLNHILGFSDIIKSSTEDDDTREFSTIIHNSGRQFLSMIEDIFNLALVEQGEVKIREQTFKLADLFLENKHSLEEILSESGKDENIELVFKPDRKLLQSYVKTDKYKINLVLTNLFRNAVKFTHQGSIEYGFYLENKKLVFYLNDTGIGIPGDKCDIIFDFFRQVDDSHTRHYEGLGIGLAISRKIAHAMNGELSVKSEEGKGSTFYFSAPVKVNIHEEEKTAPENNGQEHVSLADKTILVAEDDPNAMTIVKVLLKPTKAKVIMAMNGQEAIEAFVAHPEVDLVLMDLKMQVMDGYEATRQIKSRKPDLPVLALTAYGLVKDRKKALEAGFDEVVTKPVEPELLLHQIKRFLGLEEA